MERLQKILSHAGVASRRASGQFILEGRVSVNGAVVQTLGTKSDPDRDDIRVDGRRVRAREARRYVLLNKPTGVVTTRVDPQKRPTVIEMIETTAMVVVGEIATVIAMVAVGEIATGTVATVASAI